MTVYEALTVALIFILATGSVMAIYIGMMNWINAAHVVRCVACHHLTFSAINQPQASCAHCRHPALMHPLYTAQHPHQIRVVGDGLHY